MAQFSSQAGCPFWLSVVPCTAISFRPVLRSDLYSFSLVIPRRLNFIFQRFGALCLFHLHRQVGMKKRGKTYD